MPLVSYLSAKVEGATCRHILGFGSDGRVMLLKWFFFFLEQFEIVLLLSSLQAKTLGLSLKCRVSKRQLVVTCFLSFRILAGNYPNVPQKKTYYIYIY